LIAGHLDRKIPLPFVNVHDIPLITALVDQESGRNGFRKEKIPLPDAGAFSRASVIHEGAVNVGWLKGPRDDAPSQIGTREVHQMLMDNDRLQDRHERKEQEQKWKRDVSKKIADALDSALLLRVRFRPSHSPLLLQETRASRE